MRFYRANYSNGRGFELQYSHPSPPHYPPSPPRQPSDPDFDIDSDTELTIANDYNLSPQSDPLSSIATLPTPLEALTTRLLPLRHIEALLIAKLVPPNEDDATHFAGQTRRGHGRSQSHNQEIFVRPGVGWKGALARARVNSADFPLNSSSSSSFSNNGHGTSQRPISAGNIGSETPDEPQQILHSCRKDMMQLWNDQGIKDILRRKKIRLEDASGL